MGTAGADSFVSGIGWAQRINMVVRLAHAATEDLRAEEPTSIRLGR